MPVLGRGTGYVDRVPWQICPPFNSGLHLCFYSGCRLILVVLVRVCRPSEAKWVGSVKSNRDHELKLRVPRKHSAYSSYSAESVYSRSHSMIDPSIYWVILSRVAIGSFHVSLSNGTISCGASVKISDARVESGSPGEESGL